jgi:hypothetical protein
MWFSPIRTERVWRRAIKFSAWTSRVISPTGKWTTIAPPLASVVAAKEADPALTRTEAPAIGAPLGSATVTRRVAAEAAAPTNAHHATASM